MTDIIKQIEEDIDDIVRAIEETEDNINPINPNEYEVEYVQIAYSDLAQYIRDWNYQAKRERDCWITLTGKDQYTEDQKWDYYQETAYNG